MLYWFVIFTFVNYVDALSRNFTQINNINERGHQPLSIESAPLTSRRSFLNNIFIMPLSVTSFSSGCNALTSEQASKNYDVYAEKYDDLDGGAAASMLGIDAARKNLLNSASGSTLEVGAGTGLNLNSYRFGEPHGVTKLTLLDISEGMLSKAKSRAATVSPRVDINFIVADATKDLTSIFAENEKFDTIVDTFSLCVMGNQGAVDCLKQLKQVLKSKNDGGRLLLLENSRSDNSFLGWYQDVTADAAASAGGKGCIYNQDVRQLIQDSGFTLESEESFAGGLFRSFLCSC